MVKNCLFKKGNKLWFCFKVVFLWSKVQTQKKMAVSENPWVWNEAKNRFKPVGINSKCIVLTWKTTRVAVLVVIFEVNWASILFKDCYVMVKGANPNDSPIQWFLWYFVTYSTKQMKNYNFFLELFLRFHIFSYMFIYMLIYFHIWATDKY